MLNNISTMKWMIYKMENLLAIFNNEDKKKKKQL